MNVPLIVLNKTISMKRLFIICSAVVALFCTACKDKTSEEISSSEITLSPNTLTLVVGDMGILKVSGAESDITWSSSNETVATVTSGVVIAQSIGDAYITAKSGDASAVCHVYVTGTDGSSLRISPGVVSINKGETYQMSYGNTYGLPLTWTSSNPEVATVSETGLVKAIKAGNTTITLATSGETVTALIAVKHTWGEYKLVWSDEFEGTTLNSNNWTCQTGIGNNGWGNGEKQYYTARSENVRVADGCLIIQARKETYESSQYTSARIISRDKQSFAYGKIEASISLPSGGGLWPAFWMLGSGNWPACGEIDIMEYVGNAPNRILGTLHTTKDRDGSHSSRAFTGLSNIENNFHTYGIEWLQEEQNGKDIIRFYVDDNVYSEQVESQIDNNDYWPFNKPEFFIINLAVGGSLGGSINDAIWSEDRLMKVDWVRVYQRDEID